MPFLTANVWIGSSSSWLLCEDTCHSTCQGLLKQCLASLIKICHSIPNIQSLPDQTFSLKKNVAFFVCLGGGGCFILICLLILLSGFYLNQHLQNQADSKIYIIFYCNNHEIQVGREYKVKKIILFTGYLNFNNKGMSGDWVLYWMPSTGIFTKLPISIFENFHY